MASAPQYTATPKVGMGQVSVANTTRDGSGTLATIFTAGANGSRIETVSIKAVSSSTIGIISLYLFDGTNSRLLTEISVTAITPSGTINSFETGITLSIVIPTGYSLKASTYNAETYNIFAFGGDF